MSAAQSVFLSALPLPKSLSFYNQPAPFGLPSKPCPPAFSPSDRGQPVSFSRGPALYPMILRHLRGAGDLLLSSLLYSTTFAAPVLVTIRGRGTDCPSATCLFVWTHKGWRAFAIVSVGNLAHCLSQVKPLLNWPLYSHSEMAGLCNPGLSFSLEGHCEASFFHIHSQTLSPPIPRVSVLANSCLQWMSLLQGSPDWVTCLYSCSSYTISKHTDTVSIWPSVLNLLVFALYQVGLSVCIWFFVPVTSNLKCDCMSTENLSQIVSA